MGKELQHIALDIVSTERDISTEAVRLLNIEQLYSNSSFEIKMKVIRLLLKEKIIPEEFTFHDSAREIVSVIFNLIPSNENPKEEYDLQKELGYDEENRSLYKELLNEAMTRSIKASSMFWNKFSQITAFLKELACLSKIATAKLT
jgi:hypothetical protein